MNYLLGELNAEEAERVQQWLQQDPANAAYFNQFKTIWEKSRQLAASSPVDENRAWNQFKQRIQTGNKPRPSLLRQIIRISSAAAAILLIAAGLFWWNTPGTREQTLESGMAVLNQSLPDGSAVTLNKTSSLVYPAAFKNKKREVKLKGEAFFEVTPDKTKPFVIDVKNIQVTVLGTSFNVREDSSFVEVVVETGTVKVSGPEKEVLLQAGEKIRMPFTGIMPGKEKVKDKLYNYYRSKEFVCDDTPLWKLVQVLNEAYKSNIVIGREDLKDLRLNTTFNNESLDQVLEVIRLTFSITVRKEEGRIVLQ